MFLYGLEPAWSKMKSDEQDKSLSKICGVFYINSEDYLLLFKGIRFTENEKILICGGDQPGWSKIPRWQSINNIKNFLSSRGYNSPEFKSFEDRVEVYKGPQSEIEKLEFLNVPKNFRDFEFLGAESKVLNSDALNKIEAWTDSRMEMIGYPCSSLKTKAVVESGVVEVDVSPGTRVKIQEVQRETEDGLRSKSLSRYDAFQKGDYYNGENLSLSSRRLIRSGIVDYSDFSINCGGDLSKGVLEQRLTFSKPQSVVLSFGGTTEQFPTFRLSWRHARLDQNASQLRSELFLSPVEQSLTLFGHLHIFNNSPRLYFVPELKVVRNSEKGVFTAVNQSLSFGMGYLYDNSFLRLKFESRPTYFIEDQEDGRGPTNIKYLSLESSVNLVSHRFEYNQLEPFTGFELNFNWSFRQKGVGSDFSGNLYSLDGTYLINWGGFDPPLYVLGFRFGYSSLVTEDLLNSPNRLRLFLGGGNDLRGFARKSINNNDLGFRTTAYIGTEIRALRVLPWNLQPLLFVDVGKVSLEAFEFNGGELWSPGLGVRWQSPIGAVRATAARGFVTGDQSALDSLEEEWNYFVSLGREF
jgi:translocation and assembly module TamA